MKKYALIVLALVMCFILACPAATLVSADPADGEVVADDSEVVADDSEVVTDDHEDDAQQYEQPEAATEPEEEAEKTNDILDLIINFDGSSTLSYKGAINKQYHDLLKQQYEPMGYTVESITLGERTDALQLTINTPKEEVFSVSMPGGDSENFAALKVKRWFYTMYVVNAKYDMRQYPAEEVLMQINVKFPVLPTYSNATTKNGMTYSWDLQGMQNNSVDFVLLVPNLIGIGILIAVVAIIIIAIVLVQNNKKKKALLAESDEFSSEDDIESDDVESEALESEALESEDFEDIIGETEPEEEIVVVEESEDEEAAEDKD